MRFGGFGWGRVRRRIRRDGLERSIQRRARVLPAGGFHRGEAHRAEPPASRGHVPAANLGRGRRLVRSRPVAAVRLVHDPAEGFGRVDRGAMGRVPGVDDERRRVLTRAELLFSRREVLADELLATRLRAGGRFGRAVSVESADMNLKNVLSLGRARRRVRLGGAQRARRSPRPARR